MTDNSFLLLFWSRISLLPGSAEMSAFKLKTSQILYFWLNKTSHIIVDICSHDCSLFLGSFSDLILGTRIWLVVSKNYQKYCFYILPLPSPQTYFLLYQVHQFQHSCYMQNHLLSSAYLTTFDNVQFIWPRKHSTFQSDIQSHPSKSRYYHEFIFTLLICHCSEMFYPVFFKKRSHDFTVLLIIDSSILRNAKLWVKNIYTLLFICNEVIDQCSQTPHNTFFFRKKNFRVFIIPFHHRFKFFHIIFHT